MLNFEGKQKIFPSANRLVISTILNGGRVWTIIAAVLFLVIAVLAFAQRAVTGM